MKLAIIRHGEAGHATSDLIRPLTSTGNAQAQQLAKWLQGQRWQQAKLWASPYLRAQQTATVIAGKLGLSIDTRAAIFPEARPQDIVEELITEQQDIIFVAHQPLVGYLASLLLQGRAKPQPWQPAECWLLEGEVFAAGCMELTERFLTSI